MSVCYYLVQVNFVRLVDGGGRQTDEVVVAKTADNVALVVLLRSLSARELGVQRVTLHVQRVEFQVVWRWVQSYNLCRVGDGVVIAGAGPQV